MTSIITELLKAIWGARQGIKEAAKAKDAQLAIRRTREATERVIVSHVADLEARETRKKRYKL